MHFLNRIGALILFICIAGISNVTTLYVACGSVPSLVFWLIYPPSVALGLFMWLKDWHDYHLFTFKWYDKWE